MGPAGEHYARPPAEERAVIRIGLTGNIACGKSTVAKLMEELGAVVIDADKVAHELMLPGTPVYERVVSRFGSSIVGPHQEIDRARLGAIVFTDPSALADLDALVHPAVIQRVEDMVSSAGAEAPAVVVEAVKLIEAGMHRGCQSVWVVLCSPEVQIRRLMETRGLSKAQARTRLAAQGSAEDKLRWADVVICNDGSMADLQRQVEVAWHRTIGIKDTAEERAAGPGEVGGG